MTHLPTLPLAKSAIDRDATQRLNSSLFEELAADATTRVLPVFDGKVLLQSDAVAGAGSTNIAIFPMDAVPDFEYQVYLGRIARNAIGAEADGKVPGAAVILRVLNQEHAAVLNPDRDSWRNLRRAVSALTDLDAGLWTQSLAISNWHATHVFCPHCGAPTEIAQAGWSRRCPVDDRQVFPRTDPAIIVAVTDDADRLLLGSQGAWESNRWSVLAGFVEAGESLNSAVAREVLEESGIHVTDIEFLGSQPWPFPYSLMFGFKAKAHAGQELVPDGDEIAKLRWISRAELVAEASEMLLPGPLSIARALIENWLGHSLDELTSGQPR
ncbi:MAG: NAD(+) diphosphatase [Actinomycetales bacterium]|nr:NAD(+) diphosphatase [Actinomycetales bacterium]